MVLMEHYTITPTRRHKRRILVTSHRSQNTYVVEQQSGNPRSWTCTCRRFLDDIRTGRDDKFCIHITEVIRQQKLDVPAPADVEAPTPLEPAFHAVACTACGTTEHTKAGRKGSKQVYRCRSCGRRFVSVEAGFERMKYEPALVTAAINMVMSGMSYRKVAEHLRFSNNVRIAHNTILGWCQRYSRIIKAFVEALRPVTGNVWSVDEAVINVKQTSEIEGKGNVDWLWTAMDPKTRMILASMISADSRTMRDAVKLMALAKSMGTPDYIVTDSLPAYGGAQKKVVPTASHIRTKSVRDGFTNMAIERYHNEIREKLKICRGLGNDDSAAVFCDLLWIHHNFIRPHMGLGGRTPAQEARLMTGEVSAGKYRTLIPLAAGWDISGDRRISGRLGGYNGLVSVFSSGKAARVEPKRWLDNGQWRGIHDILTSLGFTWFFNSGMRSWIRFNEMPVKRKTSIASRAPVVTGRGVRNARSP